MTLKRLLAATAVFAALALPASASARTIQPGVPIESEGSFCTLNWIFDGAGGPYAGTAAHCVSRGGAVVNLATAPLGDVVERIGTVALRGDPDTPGRDYAIIRVDPGAAGQLNPAMAGHPDIPTGVSRNYAKDNLMQFSGNGVGFHVTNLTREQRVGVLNAIDGGHHDIIGAVTPGDSGGPVANVSDGNTAFGIVDTVGAGVNSGALTVVTAGEGGANLDFVLQDAAARGLSLTLRTVGG
jgi:hypothetical protein